jgi:putative oxidoreductase
MKSFRTYPHIALLILRIVVGVSFFLHGWQKYQMGLGNVGSMFGKMGIPLAPIAGPGITFLEMLGGAALILGAGTRVFALLLVCDMLGAILFVHGKNGYIGQGGAELVTLLATMCLTLVLAGAGRVSADANIGKRELA